MAHDPIAAQAAPPTPTIVSAGDHSGLRSRLPASLASLVGREREIGRVLALLRQPGVRLLTITGPGGIGKTRLALAVAECLTADLSDGVVFVALSPIRDPDLVVPTIAAALGVRESGERPLAEVLIRTLGSRQMLLVLDNFEHVLAASPRVAELLAACPGLRALVTSRAILRISGEHEFPLPPLTLPSDHLDPAAAESVRFFVERARAVRPEFVLDERTTAPVVAICGRLEGLPLAIELAVARLRHLPLEILASRLGRRLSLLSSGPRDQPARLQTMRNAVAWSYDLLDADQQRLFRRLAVFAGSFTLEAAARVCAAEDDLAVLQGLTSLLDQSILHQLSPIADEPRYGMLETIREYGLEHLAASGESKQVNERHAAWCLDLVERAWPAFAARVGQEPWLRRFDANHDNLRAALLWFEQRGEAEAMVALAGGLFWFWFSRGIFSEGRSWLERALALPAPSAESTASRARALFGAGLLTHLQGEHDTAESLVQRALLQWRDVGDAYGQGLARLMLGILAEDQGRYEAAAALFEDALLDTRRAGDRANEALTLNHLGIIAWSRGDLPQAVTLCEAALEVQRAIGDRWGEATSLCDLGLIVGLLGDHARAAALQRESLRLRLAVGLPYEIGACLANFGALAAACQVPDLAVYFFAAEDRLRLTLGSIRKLPERAAYEAALARARADLGEPRFAEAWAAGQASSLDAAVTAALDFQPPTSSTPRPSAESGARHAQLTEREVEVLGLVARGLTNPQIAERLVISPGTARIHVSRILSKLGARTRTEAVDLARRGGLLPASS